MSGASKVNPVLSVPTSAPTVIVWIVLVELVLDHRHAEDVTEVQETQEQPARAKLVVLVKS